MRELPSPGGTNSIEVVHARLHVVHLYNDFGELAGDCNELVIMLLLLLSLLILLMTTMMMAMTMMFNAALAVIFNPADCHAWIIKLLSF